GKDVKLDDGGDSDEGEVGGRLDDRRSRQEQPSRYAKKMFECSAR
uniref:Uncharacterized protein n=1 Tax=Caenorhabditis japonica TaxID=281687 RepID=A0A8R1E492_CAEJA